MHLPTVVYTALNKANKKDLKRFYKAHGYSASFMGYDHCYIASINNAIIGSVILSYIDNKNTCALLHALFIHPQYRKRNYGHALVQYAYNEHKKLICFADKALELFYIGNNFIEGTLENIPNSMLERFKSYQTKNINLRVYVIESALAEELHL
jgi:GNAT superfamily N-acetyltransferase